MTYHLVHQLHRDGFSISYISKYFVLDWRTVKKYLSLSETEYEAFLHTQSERKKELEPYEGFVQSHLSKYPEISSPMVSAHSLGDLLVAMIKEVRSCKALIKWKRHWPRDGIWQSS